jgi:hypothetical protein
MRRKDREEILASGGWADSERCVRANINRSVESYAVYKEDQLLYVFGVIPMNKLANLVWLLSGECVDCHPVLFYKSTKIALNYLRDRYPLMGNMVHGKYTAALRWLERLGFKIDQPEKYGAQGDLFCRATIVTQKIEVVHV